MRKKQKGKLTSIEDSEISAAKARILNLFWDFPEKEFSFNDLCDVTRTSKTTARVIVEELITVQYVERTVIGKLWRLQANIRNYRFKNYKIVHNLEAIFGTNLLEVLTADYPQARAIVLFGSYRTGDDISTSDIDIAMEIPGLEKLEIVTAGTIDKLGNRKNVRVNIHLFSRNTIDLNLFANIANGIVLHGFLEVRP